MADSVALATLPSRPLTKPSRTVPVRCAWRRMTCTLAMMWSSCLQARPVGDSPFPHGQGVVDRWYLTQPDAVRQLPPPTTPTPEAGPLKSAVARRHRHRHRHRQKFMDDRLSRPALLPSGRCTAVAARVVAAFACGGANGAVAAPDVASNHSVHGSAATLPAMLSHSWVANVNESSRGLAPERHRVSVETETAPQATRRQLRAAKITANTCERASTSWPADLPPHRHRGRRGCSSSCWSWRWPARSAP